MASKITITGNRFVIEYHGSEETPPEGSDPVLTYLNPNSQKALAFASAEALKYLLPYIGTEMLLLGVLDFRNYGSVALKRLVGDLDRVRKQFEFMIGTASDQRLKYFSFPVSPMSIQALKEGFRIAGEMGFQTLGPAFILLGILKVPEGVGFAVLQELGVEETKLR